MHMLRNNEQAKIRDIICPVHKRQSTRHHLFYFHAFLPVMNVLNHQLSQKLKLIGRDKFNHLINTLTVPLTCGLKLLFNR